MKRRLPSLPQLPRPVFSRNESLAPGSWTDVHSHPWNQLSYAVSGVLTVRTPHGNHVAPPLFAIWIPAEVEHQVFNHGHTEMRSLYLQPDMRPGAGGCNVIEVTPFLRELICRIGELPVEYDPEGPAGRLVAVLFDELAAARPAAFNLAMPRDRRLLPIVEALERNPADNRTLAEWARVAGASERTLARLFARDTGMGFGDWRRRMRLILSLGALEAGGSVTAVALSYGYESTSAYISAFRQTFGFTPGELSRRFLPSGTADLAGHPGGTPEIKTRLGGGPVP